MNPNHISVRKSPSRHASRDPVIVVTRDAGRIAAKRRNAGKTRETRNFRAGKHAVATVQRRRGLRDC